MPLLDAAIAFALTMLGLSSLVGMVQEWLHQARKVRSRHLEIMLQRLLTECLTTELATSDKTDSTESRDGVSAYMTGSSVVVDGGVLQA